LITATRRDALDEILARFEELYEAHTERLGRLMARRGDRRSARTAVYDLAEIASCRRALADTARVLQSMADRDFGRCAICAGDIPIDRLLERPQQRNCGGCAEAVPA